MMVQYVTTDKHPIYKSGLRIKQRNENYFNIFDANNAVYSNESQFKISKWLIDNWVEEIQEPEFTKDDMKKAYHAGIDCFDMSRRGLTNNVPFFEWINKFKT